MRLLHERLRKRVYVHHIGSLSGLATVDALGVLAKFAKR